MPSQEDIKKELITIAPDSPWPDFPPMEIPSGYFDAFAGELMQKLRKDAGSEEPFLQIPKTMPYRVPEHYFDHLIPGVLDRVNQAERVIKLPARRRFRWKIPVAAAIAACLVTGTVFFINHRPQPRSYGPEMQLATIPDAAIEQYLSGHTDEILDKTTLYENVDAASLDYAVTNGFSSEDLEQYLNVYSTDSL